MKLKIFTISFLSCISLMSYAQVQNTGIIRIGSSTDILYVNYAFTNASTATLTNNGQLHVAQNMTNNETMTVGTGTLYLVGSSNQSVSGTQPFRTYNLVTNNAAGITLNDNLHITNAHTFTSGIITTSATPNYLVYESGSSYSGSGDGRHVNGWVKKIGSTAFAFPVGNGTVERPVSVTALSASSEFNARHNMSTANTTSLQSPLVNADGSEYWTINRISGGTAQILMNWNNPKVSFPSYSIPDTRASYYNGSVWTNQGGSASGTASTTGTITSNSVSSFGNFTFASISAVLPVNFLGIRGEAGQSCNTIFWKTAEEFMIDHFEILRSSDGLSFNKIGTQIPFNTSGEHEYEFKDLQPLSGDSWYRIRNIDVDGHSKYSAIVKLQSSTNDAGLQVINNPVQGSIRLSTGQVDKGQYEYQLFNAAGALLQNGILNISENSVVSIPLGNKITTGVCVLRISNNANQFTQRIVVK